MQGGDHTVHRDGGDWKGLGILRVISELEASAINQTDTDGDTASPI